MKVAQLLATIPDGLPDENIEELRALQSNAPAMGWAFVKHRMAAELGAGWRTCFAEFEQAAAVLLGQVHRTRGADGRELACKLQYPNMASTVEADLRQLKLIFALYKRYDSAIDTREILHELTARLREELDHRREAGHLALYGAMLGGAEGVYVPEPVAELSTGHLLTMSWLDGEALTDAVSRPQAERNRIAGNMFTAWYLPFYRYGVLHGRSASRQLHHPRRCFSQSARLWLCPRFSRHLHPGRDRSLPQRSA